MSDVREHSDDASLSLQEGIQSLMDVQDEEVGQTDQAEPESDVEDQPEDQPADEPEETEGEPAAEEQDGEDETQPEDDFVTDDRRKVRLSDGSVVTVGDLKRSPLLMADYTRKTQEVAAQRQAIAEQQAQFQSHAQQLQQQREFAINVLQAMMPQEPSQDMMAVDPVGYMQADRAYRERVNQLQRLHAESQAYHQQQDQARQNARMERLQRENALMLETMPDLKVEQNWNALKSDVQRYAPHYGFEAQDVFANVEDHRTLRIIRDAISWRKSQEARPKAIAKAEGRPPVMRSGTRPTPQAQAARERQAAMERLNRTGSVKDGVAALLALEKET